VRLRVPVTDKEIAVRLSASDESFTHQVALPHAMVGSSDPSWRERFWLSMQDTHNKDAVLSCGFGQYPNQDVQEAFVAYSKGGRQHNLRLSRTLSSDPEQLRVGPFSIEVIRPYRELRLVLEDNPSGLSFDLRWLGTMQPILEEPHLEVHRNRVTHDAIRYVQVGRAAGNLSTPDGTQTLQPDAWWGERDHSWGTRPLPRSAGAPPAARPNWRMLFFCPVQFEDFSLHLYLYEDAAGRELHLTAGFSGPLGSASEPPFGRVVAVGHDLRWAGDVAAATLESGTVTLSLEDGTSMDLEITAHPGRACLRGGGYEGWNGWLQGHWKGEDTLEHEVWDLTDTTNFYRYAKAGSDHLIEVRYAGRTGYGVMEYIVLPGYHRYQEATADRRAEKVSP
jgi:hypothetical protein